MIFFFESSSSVFLTGQRRQRKYQFNGDGFVKSQETPLSVIPAKAGIQSFQIVTEALDSGLHRSDDFQIT